MVTGKQPRLIRLCFRPGDTDEYYGPGDALQHFSGWMARNKACPCQLISIQEKGDETIAWLRAKCICPPKCKFEKPVKHRYVLHLQDEGEDDSDKDWEDTDY